MNSTAYQPSNLPNGEQPSIPDAEDAYDAYINGLYEDIESELASVTAPTMVQKLGFSGFKKLPQKAIISGSKSPKDTSDMNHIQPEIIPRSPASKEAFDLALSATPVGKLEDLILDDHRENEKERGAVRVGEALAARANVLAGASAPEAEVVRQPGGYSTLPQGEKVVISIEAIRGMGRQLVAARGVASGKEAQ